MNPPAVPAMMNPPAVTSVPITSTQRSPVRSASRPAGIWKSAIPPEYAVRMTPTCANERENSAAHNGKRT